MTTQSPPNPGLFEDLTARGFVKQTTNEAAVRDALNDGRVTYYAGFDPTADSLHIGSLVPIMAMAHLQRAGHKPIAIVGGGTAMIGDPSGKTEMRQMLTAETIRSNLGGLKEQLGRYMTINGDDGLMLDNGEWLLALNYIEFMRDIGRHFRVNEMVKNEGYRIRLEREEGLSFIEFSYQLMQAYDFLYLAQKYDCSLQLGGDDQWGNIIAGTGLTRRVLGKTVHGLTFPLLTTASGAKMGKTASGAVWLDANKTSPYDFYQYWVNVDDADTIRFLKLFTFLSLDEIAELAKLEGADIREAKRRLAFETTKLCHGEVAATQAESAAKAIFATGNINDESVPRTPIPATELETGIPIATLFTRVGLTQSTSEAMRAIKQGGAYVNEQRIDDTKALITAAMAEDGLIRLRRGKKSVHIVEVDKG